MELCAEGQITSRSGAQTRPVKYVFSSFKDLKLISTFTNLSMIGGFKFDNGPKVENYIKLIEHYKTLAHTHSLTHSQTQRRMRRIWRR